MSDNKKIIFTTKGNVSKEDKARALSNGVLIIECADETKIKTISALSALSENDFFVSALNAINADTVFDGSQKRFVKNLCEHLNKKKS